MPFGVRWPFTAGRTPGTPDRCEYIRCREPGAGEARYHLSDRGGIPWTMCAGHLKPEHHPPDIRRAPGKLVKW